VPLCKEGRDALGDKVHLELDRLRLGLGLDHVALARAAPFGQPRQQWYTLGYEIPVGGWVGVSGGLGLARERRRLCACARRCGRTQCGQRPRRAPPAAAVGSGAVQRVRPRPVHPLLRASRGRRRPRRALRAQPPRPWRLLRQRHPDQRARCGWDQQVMWYSRPPPPLPPVGGAQRPGW
jgi:hypothetical protein